MRFSRYTPFGTARFAAQGGATGALGGDFSSVLSNPAGLAFFRSSEFVLSPSLYGMNTESEFMGNTTPESQMKFNLGSLGMVQAFSSKRSEGIVSASYAFGYQTLVNFNNHSTLRGTNNRSSLLDDFTWHANLDPDNLSPFYEELAFDSYLMPYDEESGQYWHDMQIDGYGQEVSRTSDQYGYIGEFSLSGALNVSNFLYVGASVGMHSVRFYEDIQHRETDADNHVVDLESFSFTEFNRTTGYGLASRLGLIVRPMDMLRLGATVQFPTVYRLTDSKYTSMNSYWDNGSGIADRTAVSPDGLYDYQLRTPFQASAQASLILFRMATLSLAYEYVDYTTARLDASGYSFMDENDQIRNAFQATHNLKAGGEIRLNALYLRGDAAPDESVCRSVEQRKSMDPIGRSRHPGKHSYLDFSYSHGRKYEVYGLYSYEPGINEVAHNTITAHSILCTLGFRF
ncbi:MAG: hypothetical protein R2751_15475 [Bacteroidales bacterium]